MRFMNHLMHLKELYNIATRPHALCYADAMSTSKKKTTSASRTPGETFRRRMQEARKLSNLTQRALVARLHEMGLEINQAAIARIESGERKVSLDEAVAIAAALDQAPP